MRVIGVIPARYASTRFPGKVLADLNGKPMLQHVWERVKKSRYLKDVLIACDDKRILAAAKRFGANVVMTSPRHSSGTDRIAEAVKGLKADIIINIQADEPLIQHAVIDRLAKAVIQNRSSLMATVIKKIEQKDDLINPNVVKVVVDKNSDALYFSRAGIPYDRDGKKIICYKHLGIYAYRKNFLLALTRLPVSKLEAAEKLEQLRALEYGYKIKTVLTDMETIGVDTPADLRRVKEYIRVNK